jgi:hypothetical protein
MNLINNINYYSNKAINITGDALQYIAQTTIPTMIEYGLRNEKIGRIVSGAACLATGAYILSKSLKLRAIRQKSDTAETLKGKGLRWATTLWGGATACFGAYQIGCGIKEIFYPTVEDGYFEQPIILSEPDPQFGPPNVECGDPTYKEALLDARKRLLHCSAGQDLWRDTQKEGPFTIRCVPHKAAFTASTSLHNRVIEIGPLPLHTISEALTFELNNLKRIKEMKPIVTDRCTRYSADTYALAIENIEYQTLVDAYKTMQKCIQEGTFPQDSLTALQRVVTYAPPFWENGQLVHTFAWRFIDDFSFDHYITYARATHHIDNYIQSWVRNCETWNLSDY